MKLSDQITRRQLFVAFGTSQQTGSLSSVDLAATRSADSVTLTASDGSAAPVEGADGSTAGVLTAADKTRLDDLAMTTVRELPARSEVATASVGAAVTHLRTAGYAAAGDGGGALYRRAAGEPAHAGKVQSADGAWWELAGAGRDIRQFGAVGGGATDDSAAIQAALDWWKAELEAGRAARLTFGRGPVAFDAPLSLAFSGANVTCGGVLDFSGARLPDSDLEAVPPAAEQRDELRPDVGGSGASVPSPWVVPGGERPPGRGDPARPRASGPSTGDPSQRDHDERGPPPHDEVELLRLEL